ncbi:hypothetical protein AB1282_03555 [Gottfriedia sp. S16(2024)]|uniref:hypothetical protein n=1 Tax=Gottfriedia sp. S16(2024) TaxID=3162883 RepID=UPI003D1C5BA7
MKLFKINYLLMIVIVMFLISIPFLNGCSQTTELSIKQNQKLAKTETNWTNDLANGIYLKELNKQEAILYVKLKNNKHFYSLIEVNVDKFNDKYRINIEEQNAVQDSEVTDEYFGELKSEIPFNELEVYLNGKKTTLTIIKK